MYALKVTQDLLLLTYIEKEPQSNSSLIMQVIINLHSLKTVAFLLSN